MGLNAHLKLEELQRLVAEDAHFDRALLALPPAAPLCRVHQLGGRHRSGGRGRRAAVAGPRHALVVGQDLHKDAGLNPAGAPATSMRGGRSAAGGGRGAGEGGRRGAGDVADQVH